MELELALAYIAGFLDGDGTITALFWDTKIRNRRPRFDVRVYFFNQDIDVLLFIQRTLGTGVLLNNPTGYSGCYRLDIPIRDYATVLTKLQPYLRVKKRQAELALLGRSTILTKGGRTGVTDEQQAIRNYVVSEIQRLNKKNGKDYRSNRVNSVKLSELVTAAETTPSQAAEGAGNVRPFSSAEGVTTRRVSPNDNPVHESPTGNGRDSLTSRATGRSVR